jgi:SAM-dependent methyltransferase
MTISDRYLMENPNEPERLEAKTDPVEVDRRLRLVGLERGMRALDAGAGTGAIARVMADRVGPDGRVVALDFSAERTTWGANKARQEGKRNLHFVRGDLYAPPLADSFDFVWCEFVVEYLADPDRALRSLIQLVAPGGKLVVGDLDGNGFFHHPLPDDLAEALAKLEKGLAGVFDPFAGRKLFHRLRQAGLSDLRVHALPYNLYAGTAPEGAMANWALKLQTIRPRGERVLGGAAAYQEFSDAFLALLRDPDVLDYSVLFLVEWTRPRSA